MFRNVVVALDGSPCSERALEFAEKLAKGKDGKLDILCVVDPVPILGREPEGAFAEDALAAAQAEAKRIVDAAVARVQANGALAQGHVLSGEPAFEIVSHAFKSGADAIAMGTHGRSGLKRLFAGSVAEAVLRTATCPVIVIRDAIADERRGNGKQRSRTAVV